MYAMALNFEGSNRNVSEVSTCVFAVAVSSEHEYRRYCCSV